MPELQSVSLSSFLVPARQQLKMSMCLCLVTAEVGDYCEEFAQQDYLSNLKLLPNQSRRIELQIVEHHKEHTYVLQML